MSKKYYKAKITKVDCELKGLRVEIENLQRRVDSLEPDQKRMTVLDQKQLEVHTLTEELKDIQEKEKLLRWENTRIDGLIDESRELMKRVKVVMWHCSTLKSIIDVKPAESVEMDFKSRKAVLEDAFERLKRQSSSTAISFSGSKDPDSKFSAKIYHYFPDLEETKEEIHAIGLAAQNFYDKRLEDSKVYKETEEYKKGEESIRDFTRKMLCMTGLADWVDERNSTIEFIRDGVTGGINLLNSIHALLEAAEKNCLCCAKTDDGEKEGGSGTSEGKGKGKEED